MNMYKKIFKLALGTLWCDIKHSFRGYGAILMLVVLAFMLIPPDNTSALMVAYVVEQALMRFLPACDRIYFIMPMSPEDRKRLLIYRQICTELLFILLIFVGAGIRLLIYAGSFPFSMCVVSNVMTVSLMLLETGSAFYFCGMYKEASIKEKGFGMLFGIILWVAFFTAIIMAADGELLLPAAWLTFSGCLGLFLVKLYFMAHASFEEYRAVNYNDTGIRMKRDLADERF